MKSFPINILVVDDDPMLGEIVIEYLKDIMGASAEALYIECPLKALEMTKNRHFDVILSDYKMPKMNGAELISRIRSVYPEIYPVLISSELNLELLSKEIVCDFVMKPFKYADIKFVIEKCKSKVIGLRGKAFKEGFTNAEL